MYVVVVNKGCLYFQGPRVSVSCENPLRIGFRNEYFTFASENEVDLDDLHILKIGLKMAWG